MLVYLARDIPAFVMYCVNGESGSSLLIESTDSMILYSIFSIKRLGVYFFHAALRCGVYLRAVLINLSTIMRTVLDIKRVENAFFHSM